MKFKNVKVGQTVKVKKSNIDKGKFYDAYTGKTGIVDAVDTSCSLSVRVVFDGDNYDWGNHKDIKLIKDVEA